MRQLVYRTPAFVRLTHWIIAWSLLVLLLSGLQIFNAHPALYWGSASRFEKPFVSIGAENNNAVGPRGFVRLGFWQIDTTGFLGLSQDETGQLRERAFPRWLTLPANQDLAGGRRWHFFFAWILVSALGLYIIGNFVSGRAGRDLLPTRDQLHQVGRSILDHLKLRFPHGDEARYYNVLQKLSYLGIMFGVLPFTIITGLALSPAIDAGVPWLTVILGGRQSARSLHFICSAILVLFFFVHIGMILAAGPINEMRSIITGWFALHTGASRGRSEEKS